ncbi:MAG: nitrous oxide reductase family maturation protein NosD [Chitinophagales bacterium]|nr:nitrous oxide reductase family maturation protein NosD [Chitinophagales bacterium]HAE13024.1 nitrous oxide reductase family maturation protein NosD [Bacteroidota bacterium]MCB9020634.1 nitrous oxide reductase family maturation protein NosD [Chitinophagales bacterium]HPR28164.1 nitrous oxide reductase family maturation protein NosD [Chitinophagales bacterium]HQU40671.1 nitrous oxide reductase family maturation protein NosD [Chitinophagales bacterium]
MIPIKPTKLTTFLILMLCIGTNAAVHQNEQGHYLSVSVQSMIDETVPYDTLWINGGYFFENNILITKPITIIGRQNPILDAGGQGQVLIIRSDDVTIEGLTLKGSATSNMTENAGIKIENARRVKIIANTLCDNFFGVYLANSVKCVVRDNIIRGGYERESNSGNGIHLWQCDSIEITNNVISEHRDAIYLEFVINSHVFGNHCEDNIRYGLHFMFSNNDQYRNNVFNNNGAGVAVMYSSRVEMTDNIFENNLGPSSFGILLKDITDSRITGNQLLKNTIGIRLEGTSRIEIARNNIEDNGWAVLITANCTDNDFENNTFRYNSFDVSTNGKLVLNTFDQNYWDKYEGYDLDRNGMGDVPFHPVSIFATVVSEVPEAIMLYRSFTQYLMDRAEKAIPSVTPENLVDHEPLMKPSVL